MESKKIITPADIIASRTKFGPGDMFKIVPERTFKSDNNGVVYYIPILWRNVSGNYEQLLLSLNFQLLASAAKLPPKTDVKTAKYYTVAFRKFDKNDLFSTDYKDLDEAEKDEIIKRNHEMCQALDILDEEYTHLVNNHVYTYTGNEFEFQSNEKNKSICKFKQSSRKAQPNEKGKKMIELPNPLYRLRLPIESKSRKIGYLKGKDKKFNYIVYDSNKASKENGFKGVPVKICQNDGDRKIFVDLDAYNVGQYITAFSMICSTTKWDEITISAQGVSFPCKFIYMKINRHNTIEHIITTEEDQSLMNSLNKFNKPTNITMNNEMNNSTQETKQDFTKSDMKIIQEPQMVSEDVKTFTKDKTNKLHKSMKNMHLEPSQNEDDDENVNDDENENENEDAEDDQNNDETYEPEEPVVESKSSATKKKSGSSEPRRRSSKK